MTEGRDVSISTAPLRVLTLDGGGAMGFYTLGDSIAGARRGGHG